MSRDGNNQELACLNIHREGPVIAGIREEARRIDPRRPLSDSDLAYFRQQLAGVLKPNDSVWLKVNKIRNWLASPTRLVR